MREMHKQHAFNFLVHPHGSETVISVALYLIIVLYSQFVTGQICHFAIL
jgi:hypothetical protein